MISKHTVDLSEVSHIFNPTTLETEAGGSLCEFKASLVYLRSRLQRLHSETLSQHSKKSNLITTMEKIPGSCQA